MIHQPLQMNSSVKPTRCTLSSCYRKNLLEKISPRNKNEMCCAAEWFDEMATNLFNKYLSRFRKSTSAEMKKDENLLFYDFKRSESENAKSRHNSMCLFSELDSVWNLKCYWDTKAEWQLLFAAVSHRQSSSKEKSAMPWMMEIQKCLKKKLLWRNFRSAEEKNLKFSSFLNA